MPSIIKTYGLALTFLALTFTPLHTLAAINPALLDKFINAYRSDLNAPKEFQYLFPEVSEEQITQVVSSLELNAFTYLFPVTLTKDNLKMLNGRVISGIGVAAVKNGELIPIPFQVDEFDSSGLVYIEGDSDNIKNKNIFEESDQLLFMYRDSGVERLPRGSDHSEKIEFEVKIEIKGSKPRYAYITRDNIDMSDIDYIDYDLGSGTLDSTYFSAEFNKNNLFEVENIVPKIGLSAGKDIFDSVKLELKSGIGSKFLKANIDSTNNIRLIPIGVKKGPIRETVQIKSKIYYAGIPIYTDFFNVAFYEQGFNSKGQKLSESIKSLKLAGLALKLLKEPEINFELTFKNLEGAIIEMDVNKNAGEFISTTGSTIDSSKIPGDWLSIMSNQSWVFFLINESPISSNGIFPYFMEGSTFTLNYTEKSVGNNDEQTQKLSINAKITGVPYFIRELVSTFRKQDLSYVQSIGDVAVIFKELDRKGELKKLQNLIGNAQMEMLKNKRIKNISGFAEIFLQNIDSMEFTGAEKDAVIRIIKQAVLSSGDIGDFSFQRAITGAENSAKKEGLSLFDIKIGVKDSLVWLPHSIDNNPHAFYKNARQKPVITITNFNKTRNNL